MREPKEDPNGLTNRITKSTLLKGDVVSESDFRIDGTLEGNIKVRARLVVGKDANIKGNIDCSIADITGKVVGNIKVSDLLTLRTEAHVEGEVIVGKLMIEQGANFNAVCKMNGSEINKKTSLPNK